MASIIKGVIRVGVVGGLVLGAGALIAGPDRVHALGHQLRSHFISAIDSRIDDPVAMRAQLRDLESKYPKRIADARAMLGELNEQLEQVRRDKAVSERVVSLAQADLEDLKDLLAQAEEARREFNGGGRHIVRVSFNDRTLSVEEAFAHANRVADTVASYRARVTECERELEHLERDKRQTESLLAKLTSEYEDFQMQLADLDRKIDSVSRKERMVKMMDERQRRIDELSRYKAESLDQFKSNIARRVAELDSKMETLAGREDRVSYEERARLQVDTETTVRQRIDEATSVRPPSESVETVIEQEARSGSDRQTGSRSRVAVR